MARRSAGNAATTPKNVGEHVRVIGGPHAGSEGRVVNASPDSLVVTVRRDDGSEITEPARFLRNRTDDHADMNQGGERTRLG